MDDLWHGTYVAGLIAAETHNNYGVASTAAIAKHKSLKILPVKILNSLMEGTLATFLHGLHYALTFGARVIVAAWAAVINDPAAAQILSFAMDSSEQEGAAFISAAGDYYPPLDLDSTDKFIFPCMSSSPANICVTAHDFSGNIVANANRGKVFVDVAAPGVAIPGPVPIDRQKEAAGEWGRGLANGLFRHTGTAAAAAQVASIAGLLANYRPKLLATVVRSSMINFINREDRWANHVLSAGRINATKIFEFARDQWWGYGVIPPDDTLITNVDFLDTDTRVGFVAGVFEIEALRGVSILYKWAATLEVHFLDQDGDSLGVATSCKCCSAPVGQLGTEICAIGTAVGIMLLARGGRGPRR